LHYHYIGISEPR